MAARLALGLLCCLLVGLGSAKEISLDNRGRYRDILVAISDDIAEDWRLVDKLKSAFQEASERLAVASRINGSRSFSFGHVFILVPRSWNNASVDQSATWQSEDVAHFRVGQRGNPIPHTVQPQGCGKPGLHVNLHRGHLHNTSAEDLGKQLVHEFAHLRFGVFDEFNGPEGPHSFLHNGRLQPVRCAQAIKGKFGHKDTGLPCKVDRVSLQLEPDCRYVEEFQGQTAQGSLMYTTYLASVRQFCSDPVGNPNLDHNSAAPNPHNKRCGGRSVQSVMLEHPDYRRSIDGRETDTTVNFTVVQRRESRRLVIIMDISGSMANDPLAKMKIAVRSLLLGLLEDGINCAMLTFNNNVQTLRRMAALTANNTNRQDYWTAVSRLAAGGGTAIGGALAVGMEMLGASMVQPNKDITGYIVLLTDGQENVINRYSLVQATAIAMRTSIVVDTVAFGNNADKRLEDLSVGTGGKAYFARFNSPANDLMEAMSNMVRERVPTSQKPFDVFSAPVDATFSIPIQLDASISNSAQFTLNSPAIADIGRTDLQVVSPSGVVYSKLNTSSYLRDNSAGIVTISTVGKIESGLWTVRGVPNAFRLRRGSGSEPVATKLSLVVTSKATDTAPIILDGSISSAKVELRADTQVSVYATLMQGSTLLLGANITAYVESDDKVEAVLSLSDDGVGADAVKGDGVYSAFVPTTVTKVQEYNVRLVSSSPVSRVSPAGKFEITKVDLSSIQKTPPATIGDLRATISLSTRVGVASSVRVGFTAVGARRMEGEASRYTIRLCSDPNQLLSGTDRGCQNRVLAVSAAKAGSPIESSVPQEALLGFNGTIYLAVVAENSAGVKGGLSNMVSVQTKTPDNLEEVERVGEGGGGGGGGGSGGLPVVAIVFIVIGAVLAVGLLAGLTYFLIGKKGRVASG